MSLIDDIYNGAYFPPEQVKPDSDAFRQHAANAERLSARLEGMLNEVQQRALDDYADEAAAVTDLYDLEYYRAGIRFGIRLLLEALFEGDPPSDMHK